MHSDDMQAVESLVYHGHNPRRDPSYHLVDDCTHNTYPRRECYHCRKSIRDRNRRTWWGRDLIVYILP